MGARRSMAGRLFNRNFLLLWQGQTVSLLGTQAYLVALMFWLTETTGRPALVGTMTMVGGLATFLSPIGGTLADRSSRRDLLVRLDLISGAAILALAILFFAFPDEIPLDQTIKCVCSGRQVEVRIACQASSTIRYVFDDGDSRRPLLETQQASQGRQHCFFRRGRLPPHILQV